MSCIDKQLTSDTETGPGVFETALAYTETGRMADNACLFKLAAKSVGLKYGIIPTFMAKPWGDLPGCSGHIHVSLQDESGRNIFGITKEELAAGGRKGAANDITKFISQEAEWFLAGLIDGLADGTSTAFGRWARADHSRSPSLPYDQLLQAFVGW